MMRIPSSTAPVARLRHVGVVSLLAGGLCGCVPIPIPGHVERGIPDETIATILPGTSTRADVLLALADPQTRGPDDGHFTYSWAVSQGGISFWTGAPMAVPVAVVMGSSCHVLGIRFAPDGRVLKLMKFDGSGRTEGSVMGSGAGTPLHAICAADTELSARVQKWLDEDIAEPPK